MAGAAFSPTHSASFLSSGAATSSLSSRLSTAILGCEPDLRSGGAVVGVPSWREADCVSGDVDECVRVGRLFRGDRDAKPPSMYSGVKRGCVEPDVLLCSCERAASRSVI